MEEGAADTVPGTNGLMVPAARGQRCGGGDHGAVRVPDSGGGGNRAGDASGGEEPQRFTSPGRAEPGAASRRSVGNSTDASHGDPAKVALAAVTAKATGTSTQPP